MEQIRIFLNEMKNISRILFDEFDQVQEIVFKSIFGTDPKPMPKMLFETTWENDVIIDLSEYMDAYMKSLGTSTRKKIKLMTNRITRDFPDFKVHFIEKKTKFYSIKSKE